MESLSKDTNSAASARATRSSASVVQPNVAGDPPKRTSTRLAGAAHLAPPSPGPSNIFHLTSPPPQALETPTKAKGVPTSPLAPVSPSKQPQAEGPLKPPHEFGFSEIQDPNTGEIGIHCLPLNGSITKADELSKVELSVIGSPVHEKRAHTNQWSWLHQFELARYFHAGVPQGKVRLDRLPGKVLKLDVVPVLQQLYDHLQELGSAVVRSKESLFQEIPQCESLEARPCFPWLFPEQTADRPRRAGDASCLQTRNDPVHRDDLVSHYGESARVEAEIRSEPAVGGGHGEPLLEALWFRPIPGQSILNFPDQRIFPTMASF